MILTYSNALECWGDVHMFKEKYTNKRDIWKKNYMIWIPIFKQFYMSNFKKKC